MSFVNLQAPDVCERQPVDQIFIIEWCSHCTHPKLMEGGSSKAEREVPYETSRAKECPKTRPLGGVKGDVQRQLGHHSKGNLRKQDVLKNIDGHPESHKHWEEAVMRPTLLQGPIKYRSSAITLSRRQIAPLWMTPKTSQEFADEPRSHQVIRSESDGVGVPGH